MVAMGNLQNPRGDFGTALQEIEPKLRIVFGCRHVKELREAMKYMSFNEKLIGWRGMV